MSVENMLAEQNQGFGFAQENTPGAKEAGSGWSRVAGEANDWLTSALSSTIEQTSAEKAAGFAAGPAVQRAQRSAVERDQNVGAEPGDPKLFSWGQGGGGQDAAAAGMTGLGGFLATTEGKLVMLATGLTALFFAVNK
jgi:hypothetical protein